MILQLYFARRFFVLFAMVFGVFLGLVFLVEITEQLRKFGALEDSFRRIVGLAALRCAETLYMGLPLVMMVATLAMFTGLARSSELVVTRASGRSALRALVPPAIVALLLGAAAVALMNPIVATTISEYNDRTRILISGEDRTVSISEQGLWLREGDARGQRVIFAENANEDGSELHMVQFLAFDPDGVPQQRLQAERAVLQDGYWDLINAKSWSLFETPNPEAESQILEIFKVPSTLTRETIRDSFGKPNTVSIWEMPAFIQSLEAAGFSSRAHRVWFHMELAQPLLLLSMMLIGAAFTMRHVRAGRTGVMVLTAVMLGFGLTFVRNLSRILSENGQLPVELAAWAPPVAALLLSVGILLNMEDG